MYCTSYLCLEGSCWTSNRDKCLANGQSFTLHPLPTTLHLTINRSLSNPRARPSAAQLSSSQTAVNASKTPSEASSSSSSSIPLAAKRKQTERNDIELEADSQSSGSGEARMEASSVLGLEEDTPRPKKPRSTLGQGADASFDTSPLAQPAQAARPKHGGKSLPRKAPLMASAPIPNVSGGGGGGSSSRTSRSAKARGSTLTSPKKTAKKPAGGRGKKGAAVPAPVTPVARGKIKSAEIIEDSDIDSNGEGEVEEEEDDLFAKLVGESLAEDEGPSVPTTTGGHDHDAYAEEDEDDDEEEEEDEDEENELGGARLVADQHSEWL